MSSHYYSSQADTVETSFVKKICPEEFENFLQELYKIDLSFDTFCQEIYFYNSLDGIRSEQDDTVLTCFDKLKSEFEKKTDLQLYVVYNDSDGNRGDDLNGGSFAVDKVYQLTPAGEKYKNDIKRKTWVLYG